MKKIEFHGFRIYRQEPLPETFGRVIKEQLQQSLVMCNHQFRETPDYSTHEIRKSTKRIRAVYRLFRKATGNETYLYGKEFYSNLNHVLADHRISFVYGDTLRTIATDKESSVDQRYINKLIKEREKKHARLTEDILTRQRVDLYLSGILSAELESLSGKPLLSCAFQDLVPGLRKIYANGKKWLDQVIRQPSAENLHELRKVVKSLWNTLIMIRPIWPSYYGFMVHHLDVLAQKLGHEHDLAELEKLILNINADKHITKNESLTNYIAKKRLRLQKSILPLAQRLFTDKSGMVAKRMELCFDLFAR